MAMKKLVLLSISSFLAVIRCNAKSPNVITGKFKNGLVAFNCSDVNSKSYIIVSGLNTSIRVMTKVISNRITAFNLSFSCANLIAAQINMVDKIPSWNAVINEYEKFVIMIF